LCYAIELLLDGVELFECFRSWLRFFFFFLGWLVFFLDNFGVFIIFTFLAFFTLS
jgi:hypothetical protein